MIHNNEGIKRGLVREETRCVDMSTYEVEEVRRIQLDRHWAFCFPSGKTMKGGVFVGYPASIYCNSVRSKYVGVVPIRDVFPRMCITNVPICLCHHFLNLLLAVRWQYPSSFKFQSSDSLLYPFCPENLWRPLSRRFFGNRLGHITSTNYVAKICSSGSSHDRPGLAAHDLALRQKT
jgi:hypothetical protein